MLAVKSILSASCHSYACVQIYTVAQAFIDCGTTQNDKTPSAYLYLIEQHRHPTQTQNHTTSKERERERKKALIAFLLFLLPRAKWRFPVKSQEGKQQKAPHLSVRTHSTVLSKKENQLDWIHCLALQSGTPLSCPSSCPTVWLML